MRIKAAFFYQLHMYRDTIIIYYPIFLVLLFLLLSLTVPSQVASTHKQIEGVFPVSYPNIELNFTGLELIAGILICFAGYRSLKKSFSFLLQNGVSRKSLFLSQIFSSLVVVFILTSFSEILLALCKAFANYYSKPTYQIIWSSYFETAYENRFNQSSIITFHIINFSFNFCLFLFLISISYLVAIIYYRIHRILKIAITSWALLTLILPSINYNAYSSKLLNPWNGISNYITYTYESHPVNLMLTLILLAFVFSMISYWLISTTSLKIKSIPELIQ